QVAGLPHHAFPAGRLARAAQGAHQLTGSQGVEETLAAVAVDGSHGAGVGVGQNGLRPISGNEFLPASGDLFYRLLPGDGDKLTLTLLSRPAERCEDTLRAVDGLGQIPQLGAHPAAG